MAFDGFKTNTPLYAFKYLASQTAAQVVAASEAVLHTVVINNAGATANTLTLYNAATAATADTTTDFAVIDTVELNGRTLQYDCVCGTGIVAKLDAGTNADVTITYLLLQANLA